MRVFKSEKQGSGHGVIFPKENLEAASSANDETVAVDARGMTIKKIWKIKALNDVFKNYE